jgi:hypothetical protein
MTRIICRVSSCVFWEHGICSSEEIEYELDDGCLTFQDLGDLELDEEDDDDFEWEDDEDEGEIYVDTESGWDGWDDGDDEEDDFDV